MRDRLLKRWGQVAYQRPGLILICVFVFTALLMIITPSLKLTTRWVDMMPEHDPMTVEFNNIIEKYASASNIVIVAKGDEAGLRKFTDRLVPQIEGLTKWVKRVEYRPETDFLIRHGFMLTKEKDLKNQVDLFSDLNLQPFLTAINNNFEKEFIEDDQSLSSREKEDGAIRYLDGLEFWLGTMRAYIQSDAAPNPGVANEAVDRLLLGDQYIFSNDKKMLLILVHPTFPVTDTDMSIASVNHIEEILNTTAAEFPGLEAGLTGTITLVRDEMAAMESDMFLTTIIAMILILALFIFSFRIWSAPLLAAVTLVVGLIWASIYAVLAVGTLNMMTSMFAIILIGLGIDFSIHIISLFTEMRGSGMKGIDALPQTLSKVGPGVITGALTTSCAFLTLTISDSRGLSDFGLVAGGGLIFCMMASIIILPPLLAIHDKIMMRRKKTKVASSSIDFKILEITATKIIKRPGLIFAGGLLVTAALLLLALNLTFDYNYLNMEPKGLKSVILQDEMIEAFDISPDFVLVTAEGVEQARKFTESAKDFKSVATVESISEYIPSTEQQNLRRQHLIKIRHKLDNLPPQKQMTEDDIPDLIEQIARLEMNIIEMADMAYLGGQDRVDQRATLIVGKVEDSLKPNLIVRLLADIETDPTQSIARLNSFQKAYYPVMKKVAMSMANPEEITLENLPTSIVDKYVDSTGNHFLVTIYPDQQVWDFEFLKRFSAQMTKVSERITGTPPLFLRMMSIVGQEGMIGTGLAIIVVFILLMIDFRSLRLTLLAMVPLIIGFISMLGLLKLCGLQLTFLNVMAIPLIVGIGIDDGVHALHRYRREGRGSIVAVMRSTGRAILITSLTTMLAFGSLIFATYRGLGSMGILLFLGVGACFLATFFLLTALVALTEKKHRQKEI